MAGEPIGNTGRRRPGILDPGGGGILGAIGAMQGLPSREEAEVLAQEARIGESRQEAFTALANEIQKAQGDVSRGVVNFFNTEAGQNVFANDPGFLEEAQRMLRFAQQPAEIREQSALAHQADQGEGTRQQLAQAEIQRRIAEAQVQLNKAQTGGGTAEERAWATLVDAGQASELEAAAGIAGATKIIQKRDRFGALQDEYVKVNTLTNERTPISAAGSAERQAISRVAQPEPLGGQQQDIPVGGPAEQAAGPQREDALTLSLEEGGEPGAEIIRASGAVPMALRIFSGIGGQVSPEFAQSTETARANAARLLENEFVVMQRQAGDRMPQDQLERIRKTISQIGAFQSPTDAGQKLLQVHNFLDRTMQAELTTIQDERLAEQTRVNASNSFAAMRRFKSLMPAREDIQSELEAIQNEDPVELTRQQFNEITGEGAEAPEGSVSPGPGGGGPPAGDIRGQDGRLPEQAGVRPEPPGPGREPGAEITPQAGVFGPPPSATLSPEERQAAITKFKGLELPGPVLQAMDTLRESDREAARILEPVTNMASGANAIIVETLGVAPEAVNEALQLMGQDGFAEEPGDATEAMKAALEEVGVDVTPDFDRLADRIGRATFNATVGAASFLVAAPWLAAQRGSTVVAELASGLRNLATRHPRIFALGETLGVGGGEITPDIARSLYGESLPPSLDPVLRTGGALLFGLLPGLIPGLSRITFRRDLKDETEGALGEVRSGRAEGDGGAQVDLSTLRAAAEQATEVDRQFTNNTIRAIINKFAPGAIGQAQRRTINPEQSVLNIRRGLRRALDGPIRKRERAKWRKVDMSRTMKHRASKITEHVNKMVNQTPEDVRDSALPMPIIKKIKTWKNRDKLTIKDVHAMGTDIDKRIRALEARGDPRKVGALKNLRKKLLNEMETAYPNDKSLLDARAFTQWLNDRLTRGPVGDLIRSREPFDPETALASIMQKFRDEGGGQATPLAGVIGEVAQEASRPSLIQQSRSFIRNRFGQLAAQLDENRPAGRVNQTEAQREGEVRRQQALTGREFLNNSSTRRWMENAPDVMADAQIAQRNLAEALEQQARIETSAWAKFSNADPQTAVNNLMSSPDKVEATSALVNRMQNDPEALQALRVGLVDWLYQGIPATEAAPSRILQRLNQGDTREVLKAAWGNDRIRRLDAILEAGASRERGELPMLTQIGQFGTRRGAQVLGALGGRLLNTGTIQTPGILSAASGNIAQRMMTAFSPARLTAQALMDPKWERFLLSKVPKNLDEARSKVKQLNALAGSITASTNLLDRPDEDQNAQ